MNWRVLTLSVSILALATFALAQSVDGKWSAEVQGGRGPQQLTITLKADGGKLTGSIAGGRRGEVELQDGTISGSAIKFKSVQQGRGGQVTMNWAGTVKGDEIAFTRTPEGGQAVEFTAKRQK
jgi:hypothetical protein